ncbi:MAG: EAL domain-containing protein, partial [Leptolyngbyaceae cyanobacterium]
MINHETSQRNLVNAIAAIIHEHDDVESILQIVAEKVREFLAVDRIKIYQFAADDSGQVIAEAILDDNLPTLKGLHFPATDIPPSIRQQFIETIESVVIDVSTKHKSLRLVPPPRAKTSIGQAVSESYEVTDPCHLQYLLNMGVLASLSTPILYHNTLWGLMVAHHSQTRRFSQQERQTVELVTKEISLGIAQKELFLQVKRHQQIEAFFKKLNQLIEQNLRDSSFKIILAEIAPIFVADAAYLYIMPGLVEGLTKSYDWGLSTPINHLDRHTPWQDLLQNLQGDRPDIPTMVPQVYLRAELAQDSTIYQALAANKVGSLLVIPIRSQRQWLGSLVLLRQEHALETTWAGRGQADERNALPRQSFAAWCEIKQHTPDWQPEEIQLGRKVGESLCTALVHQFLTHLIDYQASHDTLTQLPKAEFFQGRLALALEQLVQQGEVLAVVMIDLDQFKRFNDSLGVSIGDQLLLEVAKRLRNRMAKDNDADDHNLLARWHGDCFIFLLSNLTYADEAVHICRYLLDCFQTPFRIRQELLTLSASAGIAFAPYSGDTDELLIHHAEIALHEAKKRGRAAYVTYQPGMGREDSNHISLENALINALAQQELSLVYQPQVEVATGKIVGLEALLRWNSPSHGNISPGVFIPIAERLGLIRSIGEWVFQTACEQVQEWKGMELPLGRISVNLSPHQLNDPEIVSRFQTILTATGADPEDLGLEITESALMENIEVAKHTLGAFREMGFKIALDDFGTGYSSLSVLRDFSIDVLKISRPFLQHISSDPKEVALYRAMVGLGKSLNLVVIAEGVETESEWEFVQHAGCNIVQGYWTSRPLAVDVITSFVLRQERRQQLLQEPETGARVGGAFTVELPGAASETPLAAEAYSLVTTLTEASTPTAIDQAIEVGLVEYAQLKSQMKQQAAREHIVMEIASKVRQSLYLPDILDTVVTEVRELLQSDRLFLFKFDENWVGEVAVESVSRPEFSIIGESIDEPCFREKFVK